MSAERRRGRWARIGTAERGFTLVELLVAMTLFLILSGIVLTAVITMSRGLDRARVSSDISAEARVAVERIARELRQVDDGDSLIGLTELDAPTDRMMTIKADFDGSGGINSTPDNPEVITYTWDPSTKSIAMVAKDNSLVALPGDSSDALLAGHVVDLHFTYKSSNWSRYPTGVMPDPLAKADAIFVDQVEISLDVDAGDGQVEHFATHVTLRNRSQS
jgi:prepilin-type N-terminal cleavage/methylation domain-containing protein